MSQADDLHLKIWQGYNEQGEPSLAISRDEAAEGALHGAAHLWLWRKKASSLEILLQKRADNKRTWPGYYDISAAGHIDVGETPMIAALRELDEELGIELQATDVQLLFVYRQYGVDETSDIIENEYQWVYGHQLGDDAEIKQDDDEVQATKWVNLAEAERLIENIAEDKIVPQGSPYFTNLLAELKRQAGL